jgi:hypothetical protein
MADVQKPYAKYELLPKLSYNIISSLMDNSEAEIIWKLLKYQTKDDWYATDLTKAEKRVLVYDGSPNGSIFSIFLDSGMDETLTAEKCYLRIYPYSVNPEDAYKGIIDVAFEIICHNNINTLSNYTTRVDSIIASLLTSLNGVNVGGVGVLFFDASKSRGNKVQNFNQIPYKAKVLIMSTRSG